MSKETINRVANIGLLSEAGDEVTHTTDSASVQWPAAGWRKNREKGGVRKTHAIVDYLMKTWKPFLDATGAIVTLEILDKKDPGAGTALRRNLERRPMPSELRFVTHDKVMQMLADRPMRLVDAAPSGNMPRL